MPHHRRLAGALIAAGVFAGHFGTPTAVAFAEESDAVMTDPIAPPAPGDGAIIPLVSVNLEPEELDVLTNALANALRQSTGTSVRGGLQVRRLLPEAGLPAECPILDDCVARVRRLLEADFLVFLVMTRLGEHVQIDPTVVFNDRAEARAPVRARRAQLRRPDGWPDVGNWVPRSPTTVTETDAPSLWPVWALGGVSLISLGVGIGFGVSAKESADTLEQQGCTSTACPAVDIDRVSDRALAADVLYAVSGATALAAVITYFVLDEPDVVLSVGADAQSISVTARF